MRVYYSLDGNNPSTMAFLCRFSLNSNVVLFKTVTMALSLNMTLPSRLACTKRALDLCPASNLPGNPRVNLVNMFPR